MMTKKKKSDLAELSSLKRCQDTAEVTDTAERLRKNMEDEGSSELVFHDAANKQEGACERHSVAGPGLMRLQCRTASSISSNPLHRVKSAPQTCLLCMACGKMTRDILLTSSEQRLAQQVKRPSAPLHKFLFYLYYSKLFNIPACLFAKKKTVPVCKIRLKFIK